MPRPQDQPRRKSAQYQATQEGINAGQAVAGSQRTMLDTQQKARLAASTATARAGFGGASPDIGSPVADVGQIAKRGSYLAAMDLFRGQNQATGALNQAQGTMYSGQIAENAANINAAGTIAGGVGSMVSSAGRYMYPQVYGRMGYG